MGVPDIPPLAKIRSMKFGQLDVENLISKGEDDSGLPISIIKPSEIAKLNLSNPTISPNIARYPRKTTIIKEQRDGTRLHEIISPWASVNNTHFHVGEPVKVTSNALAGVITAFYENDEQNVILAEIKIAEEDRNDENDHNCLMERRRLMTVPLLNLSKDVEPSIINESMTTSGQLVEKPKENSKIPQISVPVNLFIDDTSTNVSKRWQPMHCAQMQLAGPKACTNRVQELAQRKELIDFLGHLSAKDPNYEIHMPVLLMPNRCNNKKAILQELSSFHPQCLLLQGLVDLGTPSPTVDGKMITYQSCRSQDGSVIKEGLSLAYINRENEVEIGLFKRGYLLLLEKQRKSLITVEKGHIQTTSFLGCPIVHFMNETDVVPLHRVLSYVPLVHHCGHSHCTIREGRTTIRVEQEDKDVYRRFVVHNMNHAVKVYVVDVYSLKCPSGIPSADLKTCSKKL